MSRLHKLSHLTMCSSGHYLRSFGRIPFSSFTGKHQTANQSLWAWADWPWKPF